MKVGIPLAAVWRMMLSTHPLDTPLPLEDDIQLLVGLVGVQESAVLTGDQRLETQFAACRADGLANRDSLVPEE